VFFVAEVKTVIAGMTKLEIILLCVLFLSFFRGMALGCRRQLIHFVCFLMAVVFAFVFFPHMFGDDLPLRVTAWEAFKVFLYQIGAMILAYWLLLFFAPLFVPQQEAKAPDLNSKGDRVKGGIFKLLKTMIILASAIILVGFYGRTVLIPPSWLESIQASKSINAIAQLESRIQWKPFIDSREALEILEKPSVAIEKLQGEISEQMKNDKAIQSLIKDPINESGIQLLFSPRVQEALKSEALFKALSSKGQA